MTQASLRVAGALWALDPALAHQRQFPAVDWEISYSLYAEVTKSWFAERVAADWPGLRAGLLQLLQRERELREIAGLVGPEALQDKDRLLLSTAHLIREVVLGQNAYDPNDASSPVEKTYRLALLSHELYESALSALDTGIDLEQLDLEPARRALTNFRNAPADEAEAWAGETAAALAVLRGRAAETSEAAASTEVASTLEPVPTGGVSARAGSTGNE